MKNQKFFFSVVAVLFVLGVFVLFFFGFKSQVFAKVGTVNLTPESHVAVVNAGVTSYRVDAVDNVGNKLNVVASPVYGVALNGVSSTVTANSVVLQVRAIKVHGVQRVSTLVKSVPNKVSLHRLGNLV